MIRKERLTLSCSACGNSVLRLACQIRPGRVFCSRACLGMSKRRGREYRCAECDAAFYRRNGEADSLRQFCSLRCYGEWRVRNRVETTYPRVGSQHVHRIVAKSVLGRSLRPGETVHHVDGDRTNNDSSNLVVFPSQADHARCHFGEMSDAEISRFSLV